MLTPENRNKLLQSAAGSFYAWLIFNGLVHVSAQALETLNEPWFEDYKLPITLGVVGLTTVYNLTKQLNLLKQHDTCPDPLTTGSWLLFHNRAISAFTSIGKSWVLDGATNITLVKSLFTSPETTQTAMIAFALSGSVSLPAAAYLAEKSAQLVSNVKDRAGLALAQAYHDSPLVQSLFLTLTSHA